jgi:hypothetical protein
MTDDDDVMLLKMAAEYTERANNFEASAERMQSRLDDPRDLGILNSRDSVAEFVGVYTRRAAEARRKAALLLRLRAYCMEGLVNG